MHGNEVFGRRYHPVKEWNKQADAVRSHNDHSTRVYSGYLALIEWRQSSKSSYHLFVLYKREENACDSRKSGRHWQEEFLSSRIAESMLKCGSLILDLPSNTLSSILIFVPYPSVIHRANSLHLMRHYLRDFCMACLVTNETSAAVLDAE